METNVGCQTGKVSRHIQSSKERYLLGQNLQISWVIPFIKLQTQPANFRGNPHYQATKRHKRFREVSIVSLHKRSHWTLQKAL